MAQKDPARPVSHAVSDDWDAPQRTAPAISDLDDGLTIEVEGFSGPLDLLLALARTHKLDLSEISISALVDQYLAFIHEARRLRIEVAADYLVMAAWLAFLKSRLLLPKDEAGDEPAATGEELARQLAFRLQRLDAMRTAYERLLRSPRLGRDVFARGRRQATKTVRTTTYSAELYDLLKAYAEQRKRKLKPRHVVRARPVWSVKDARERLERLLGSGHLGGNSWLQLDLFLSQYLLGREESRTALAASFGASLEMARDGRLELRQEEAFGPLLMRPRCRDDRGDVQTGVPVS